MVQPYFFAHHHLHQRKIQCLRDAGFDAWGLACVPDALYREHADRYRDVQASGTMKILRVNNAASTNRAVGMYIGLEALVRRRVLVHVLRCDPSPLIKLRRLPVLGSRIRYVLEYEGDMPAELVYQEAYLEYPRPPEDPPQQILCKYYDMLQSQTANVRKADGIVLMSQEHIALWETRLGQSINSCVLPTLPDPERIRFNIEDRLRTRDELGISGKLVFIYVGNVITKWQRFDAMTEFVAALSERLPCTWFLALVRVDDLNLACEAVERRGLSERATVIHAPPDAVSRYLSAADIALFLRHQHTMNRVVTSAKLGEYLAAGLPVVTTGANAEILNELIRDLDAGAFIPDSLAVDDTLITKLKAFAARADLPEERARISETTIQRYSGPHDPFISYCRFVRKVMGDDRFDK